LSTLILSIGRFTACALNKRLDDGMAVFIIVLFGVQFAFETDIPEFDMINKFGVSSSAQLGFR
jgi:hypothetical protein